MIKTTHKNFKLIILEERTNPSFHVYKNGLNKFLARLLRTKKFLSGNTKSLAYNDHIVQFGLNKFLPSLAGESN